MNNEAKYNFDELERHILLAHTDDRVEAEKELDKAETNIAELKRIFKELS